MITITDTYFDVFAQLRQLFVVMADFTDYGIVFTWPSQWPMKVVSVVADPNSPSKV